MRTRPRAREIIEPRTLNLTDGSETNEACFRRSAKRGRAMNAARAGNTMLTPDCQGRTYSDSVENAVTTGPE